MSDPSPPFLPYGRQSVDATDVAAVVEALRAELLTTGPQVDLFERDLSARTGGAEVAVCINGTAALHLAAMAIGIGPGDAVIVPSVTFVATAVAVHHCGGRVIFADVDPDTGLLTAETLEAALGRAEGRVAAVMPVHLAGQSVDMAAIAEIARRHGLKVIEDACHALGSVVGEDPVGACRHSDAVVFSFHPVKTATSGEGGAIASTDAGLVARMRRLRNHGLSRDPADFVDRDQGFAADGSANLWYYEQLDFAFNFRLPDIACALGRSQLRRLDDFVAARRRLVEHYDRRLAPLAPLVRSMRRLPNQRPSWHLQVAMIDFDAAGIDRQTVMRELKARGIGSQVHYIPVHRQPLWRSVAGTVDLPGADAYYRRALSLPLYYGMTEADVDRVVDGLTAVLGR